MKKCLVLMAGVALLAACHQDAGSSCVENRAKAEAPVYFEFGSDVIRPEFKQQLDQGLIYVRGHRFKKVYLDGFADERGTDAFNIELSKKRAEAVRDYFVSHGVDDSRIIIDWHGVEPGTPYEKHRLVKVLFE